MNEIMVFACICAFVCILSDKMIPVECTNCKATDDYDLSNFTDRIIQELLR